MIIDLSQDELNTLQEALECWEKESHSSVLMTSILTSILMPKEQADKENARREIAFKKANEECKRRKLKSLMLGAKFAGLLMTVMTGNSAVDSTELK